MFQCTHYNNTKPIRVNSVGVWCFTQRQFRLQTTGTVVNGPHSLLSHCLALKRLCIAEQGGEERTTVTTDAKANARFLVY